MSYSLQKLTIGAFLFFVESGKQIDGTTVGASAYPDVEPPENWNSLGCISEFNSEAVTETETEYYPNPAGGYNKIEDTFVVQDVLKFVTRQHCEPFWRMLLGFKEEIANGIGQTPFAEKRRHIEGWLKVQGRGPDGADRIVMNVWGRLRIDSNPKWSKAAAKPALRFEVLYSPIATAEPAGIV